MTDFEYGQTSAAVLADSISPHGVRLTTFELQFPRFILAEVNTHRMLSRNSASSRAIPPERLIERVLQRPFVPEFNARVKGMGVGDALSDTKQRQSRYAWLNARDAAVDAARQLIELDVDKSRVNRLLEPWLWHTAIVSGTEWAHFLALRDNPSAQPEFQLLAALIRVCLDRKPIELREDDWHLPLITDEEREIARRYNSEDATETLKHVSSSRCARVSFDRHADAEPLADTLRRYDRLLDGPHPSPMEHVARPFTEAEWRAVRARQLADTERQIDEYGEIRYPYWIEQMEFVGNLRGWVQHRKEIPNEAHAERTGVS
jgi:hypothetical protein